MATNVAMGLIIVPTGFKNNNDDDDDDNGDYHKGHTQWLLQFQIISNTPKKTKKKSRSKEAFL